MSFQYFKSKHLGVPVPEGTTPPPGGVYYKTNIQNLNDGGVVLKVQFMENGNIKHISFLSGSISSSLPVQSQLGLVIGHIFGPNSPVEPTTQEDFEAALGEYVSFVNSI